MKKFLLFLMIALTGGAMKCAAQDVIVKKDGSTIVSKVLEITSTEVKYKKFTNLEGPTYTIVKSEVQVINYENGEKETFDTQAQQSYNSSTSTYNLNNQSLSDRELLNIVGSTDNYMKKAKRLKIVGWTVGPPLFIIGVGLMGFSHNTEWGISGIILAAGGIATTTGCLVRAHKLKMQGLYSINAIPLYEREIQFCNGTSLMTGIDMLKDNHLNSQTIGVGLRYNF